MHSLFGIYKFNEGPLTYLESFHCTKGSLYFKRVPLIFKNVLKTRGGGGYILNAKCINVNVKSCSLRGYLGNQKWIFYTQKSKRFQNRVFTMVPIKNICFGSPKSISVISDQNHLVPFIL